METRLGNLCCLTAWFIRSLQLKQKVAASPAVAASRCYSAQADAERGQDGARFFFEEGRRFPSGLFFLFEALSYRLFSFF